MATDFDNAAGAGLDAKQALARLDALEAALQAETAAAAGTAAPVALDQTRQGRLSRMDALQQQQMALEAQRRRQLQPARIGGARRRLARGEWGLCTQCAEAIDPRRMQVDPTASRCLECSD